ncbi:MAG: hypothetical protein DCC71_04640 [Proteobacteria bacterium]|nr:MAG: hypothetical protein DCC71_04640 [Pseudomonadota bacterium]
MYLGAYQALSRHPDADCVPQACHSMRELMTRLPASFDVPMPEHKLTLKEKVRNLQDSWKKLVEKHGNGGDWPSQVDGRICAFLDAANTFFEWLLQHLPKRKDETRSVIRLMDGSGQQLPPALEDEQVDQWERLRQFFVSVSHHGKQASVEDTLKQISILESLLIAWLLPAPYEDYAVIDKLIGEGA